MNNMFEFFRNHIKMSLYGTRCEIYNQLGMPLNGDPIDATTEVAECLKKLDSIIDTAIATVSALEHGDTENCKTIDTFRYALEHATETARTSIDGLMCTDCLREILKKRAAEKQRAMEQAQRAMMMQRAVSPENISGAPEDFKNAETVKVEKKDGEATVTPVTE